MYSINKSFTRTHCNHPGVLSLTKNFHEHAGNTNVNIRFSYSLYGRWGDISSKSPKDSIKLAKTHICRRYISVSPPPTQKKKKKPICFVCSREVFSFSLTNERESLLPCFELCNVTYISCAILPRLWLRDGLKCVITKGLFGIRTGLLVRARVGSLFFFFLFPFYVAHGILLGEASITFGCLFYRTDPPQARSRWGGMEYIWVILTSWLRVWVEYVHRKIW